MSRVSRFGVYQGFSNPAFDGFERRALHVVARDGTRLAVDVFRPTRNAVPHVQALPAVVSMTPYDRAQVVDGAVVHALSPYRAQGRGERFNNLRELCSHGYVIVMFDVRGQGASFGQFGGCFTIQEARDAVDVIAWLRQQVWCSGRIGMLGSSYGGQTQFLVAAEKPPGLQALFPCHSLFDAYDVHFPGGLTELQIPRAWAAMVDRLSGRTAECLTAPVDGDEGPELLRQAVLEHRAGPTAATLFARLFESRFRDGNGYFDRSHESGPQNLCTLLPRLQQSALPAYHWGGWNDYYPGQAAMWFCNWRRFAPARLCIGPWSHTPRAFTSPRDDEDLRLRFVESLRWFDRWLKDVDNGVEREAPVHYAVQQGHRYQAGASHVEPDNWDWRSSLGWPLGGTQRQRWWLADGPSASVASTNDGRLLGRAQGGVSRVAMTIDANVSTGSANRMGAGFAGVGVCLPEMSELDDRGLTWTSDPLERELTMAGIPQLALRVGSDAQDVALIAWLEDVDPTGRSTLITYGQLRASHRATAEAPYDTAGALWHPGTHAVVAATPPLAAADTPVQMSLLPTANRFPTGHRIRLTLVASDANNLESLAPGSTLAVSLGGSSESWIEFPVLG